MSTLTDKAWDSLKAGETEFEVGKYLFNGCVVTITERNEPYGYTTRTGTHGTKSTRYSGTIKKPNGKEKTFTNKRGGQIARDTGFFVTKEQYLYHVEGESYVLPYMRK